MIEARLKEGTKEHMSQQWEREVNEVLSKKGILATQEIALVVLYHFDDHNVWKRLNPFCQVFEGQFARAHPAVRINKQTVCLPYADADDVLPYLCHPHILLMLVSVEYLLELHEISSLYEAIASSSQDTAHRIGIIARSVPLDDDQLAFTATFPTGVSSLALCQDDDEVFTQAIQKVWELAREIVERL